MMKFNIGEKLSFEPTGREKQIGILVKYNKKTVTVITEQGEQWNVSPHLLSKIDDITFKQVKLRDRNYNSTSRSPQAIFLKTYG